MPAPKINPTPTTTLYAIDHTTTLCGKYISNSKRRIRFRFATKSLGNYSSDSLRKEEYDITLIWSINSGKTLILCNGQEVHFSEAITRYPKLDVGWNVEGMEVRLVAYVSVPRGKSVERQYDLFVGGRSYFTFPREEIAELIEKDGDYEDDNYLRQSIRASTSETEAAKENGTSIDKPRITKEASDFLTNFLDESENEGEDADSLGKETISADDSLVSAEDMVARAHSEFPAAKSSSNLSNNLEDNPVLKQNSGEEKDAGSESTPVPGIDETDDKNNEAKAQVAREKNSVLQATQAKSKFDGNDGEVATEGSAIDYSEPYCVKKEVATENKPKNKTQDAQLQTQQDQGPVQRRSPRTLTFFAVGVIVAIPMVISLAVISSKLLYVAIKALQLGLDILKALVMGLLPLAIVLRFSPQLQLLGYKPISAEIRVSNAKKRKSKWDLVKRNFNSIKTHTDNLDIPWITEVHSLLNFSDYVYIFSNFRRMSLMGKVPVHFKYLSLECDDMKQWDVIRGVPNKLASFDENGNGKAGIHPTTLMITVLRSLIAESKDPEIMDKPCLVERFTLMREHFSERFTIARRGSNNTRVKPSEIAYTARECIGHPRKVDIFRGLDEFEDFFLRHVLDTSVACESHELGGTLCSKSGLHGVQCFLDAIVKESKNGNMDAEELIELFSRPIDEKNDTCLPAEVARTNELLFRVAAHGNIFKKRSYETFKVMRSNDTRIVWTNDRSSDAECLYIIAVSHTRRRVTVTFRGTATISDMLKDINFSILEKPNPIKTDYSGKTDTIELHGGFSEYLFDPRYDTKRTKFDEIADRVYEFGKELGGDGFSLYVTGHSLGGSLSQLFGFHASLDDRFAQKGNPVRVFTFAAAIPGLVSFAKAFQYQERAGRVQHLRIHNDNDIVPLTHTQYFGSSSAFAQTGISMCLQEDATKLPFVKYIQDLEWWGTWEAYIQTNMFLNFNWSRTLSAMSFHSTKGYMHRIDMVAEKMKEHGFDTVTLNDLYAHYVGTSCTQQKVKFYWDVFTSSLLGDDSTKTPVHNYAKSCLNARVD